MIDSAAEFVSLRQSALPEEYGRAAGEEASLDVWADVIERYPAMREWVAYNKTVPLSILDVLAGDPDPTVRHAVAVKRKLSPQLFARLSADPDESVRAAIARNPKVPAELLGLLSRDPSPFVASVARSRVEAEA